MHPCITVLLVIKISFTCSEGRQNLSAVKTYVAPCVQDASEELQSAGGSSPGTTAGALVASTSGRPPLLEQLEVGEYLSGMVTVHMIRLYGGMADALPGNRPGTIYALLANMAVRRAGWDGMGCRGYD